MATSFTLGEYAEPEDFLMEPVSNKAAFRGLKLYVKDLDSTTLPPFLARVCAPDRQSSYSDEELLCILETAAEVHGRIIVPHMGHIISTVIRIMPSVPVAGCSKLVLTLSRYGLDPLAGEEERSGIISSICRPLSDCLMHTTQSISSGSALCITALVQSNNWQFASNEMVNDVCLKISGALEEAHCQTVVHVNLVVALLKHNPLTLEPYGRSLIRSGLHILDDRTKASNSQMIMSSIQMIHSIMKSLDVRIISSEISTIIHALEQCQDDCTPDICTAAFQAAETAKLLGKQEEYREHKKLSPLANCSGTHSRKGSNSPIDDEDIRDSASSGSPCGPKSVRSFAGFDSEPSTGQCVSNLGSARARRRLWSNGSHSSHGVHTAASDSYGALSLRGQSNSAGLVRSGRRYSAMFTRVGDPCPTCLTPQATNRCSQVSRRQSLSADTRMQSTPRKQLHPFSSCRDSEGDDHQFHESPAFWRIQCSGHGRDHFLFQKNGEAEEGKGYCKSTLEDSQWHVQNTDLLTEDLKFPTNSGRSDSTQTPCKEHQADQEKMTGRKEKRANCSRSPFFLFICVVLIILFLLAWWKKNPSEPYFVPT